MGILAIRLALVGAATLLAMLFAILAYFFPEHMELWFPLEVILFPTIYIIGNAVVEHLIEQSYKRELAVALEEGETLNRKYYNACRTIRKLRRMLDAKKKEHV